MYRANSGSVDFKRHSKQRYQTQVEQSNLNNLFSQQTNQFCFLHPHCHLAYHDILIVVNSSDIVHLVKLAKKP